jgi:hypothetical protein
MLAQRPPVEGGRDMKRLVVLAWLLWAVALTACTAGLEAGSAGSPPAQCGPGSRDPRCPGPGVNPY